MAATPTNNKLRTKRLLGGSTGTMVAVLVAWGYQKGSGEPMPGEVSAAIGGLLTTVLVCLDDLISIFVYRKPP